MFTACVQTLSIWSVLSTHKRRMCFNFINNILNGNMLAEKGKLYSFFSIVLLSMGKRSPPLQFRLLIVGADFGQLNFIHFFLSATSVYFRLLLEKIWLHKHIR